MNITIKFSEWDRGNNGYFLHKGKRCVLGHVFGALGMADVTLEGRRSLAELPLAELIPHVPDVFYDVWRSDGTLRPYAFATDFAVRLTEANDKPGQTDEARIEAFDLYLSRLGYALTFIDDEKECNDPHQVDAHVLEMVA